MAIIRLIAAGLLALTLTSCAAQPADAIIGKWRHTSLPWTMEFTKGGQVRMQTIGATKSGTYRLDATGNLKIEMKDGGRFQSQVVIEKNELTVTDVEGWTSTFQRADP